MEYHYNKTIYTKEALIKAAYAFIDTVYIHLDTAEDYFIVSFEAKKETELPDDIREKFENELLAQTVRYSVQQRTKNIRELLIARAMSSSLTINGDVDYDEIAEDVNLDDILKDWFEK